MRQPMKPHAVNQDSEPLRVVYREDAASYALAPHHHDSHELILTTRGRSRFHIAGHPYEAAAGDLLLISNLEPHDVEVLAWPYHRYYVLIQPDALYEALRTPALEALFRYRPEHFCHKVRLEPAEAGQTEALLQQMVQEQALDLPFRTLAMENALRTLLILLYRTNANRFPSAELSQTARDMLEVQRHLDSHETEPLKLKEIAALFHYDMYHLSRAFHRTTGYGFREYLVRRRVNLAARLLRDTTDNVTQISAACGFNSVPHFIRTFRQILGNTPLQYRKATQKPLPAGNSGQAAASAADTRSNNGQEALPAADTFLTR